MCNSAIRKHLIPTVCLLGSVVPVAGTVGPLPFRIEENRGQVDDRFRFVVRAAEYFALLSNKELRIHAAAGSPVRMRFLGASPRSSFGHSAPMPGKVNYFPGPNESAWLTNITLHSVYQGIDVQFREGHGGLEYDFLVAPRSDASQIRLQFLPASVPGLQKDGSLLTGSLHQRAPIAYQLRNGRRHLVECHWAVRAAILSFRLGTYDPSMALIIDPLIDLMPIAGTGGASVVAASADPQGNMYLAGKVGSTGFPNTPGAFDSMRRMNYVMKLSPAGKLLFSTYFGGSGSDRINGIAVDVLGNSYLTGTTFLSDFPVTVGAFQTQPKYPGTHAFVTKLSAAGDRLLYSTYLSGSGSEAGNAIAVDSLGRAYVAGTAT